MGGNFKSFILFGFVAVVSFSAMADIRDQIEIRTGKAELVIPSGSPQVVAEKVKDALSQFAIPAHANFRSLPSTFPARPDSPESIQRDVRGAPAIEYRCTSAYAEIVKRPPPVNNAFMYLAEQTQACIYPFAKGVKVFLIFTIGKKSESMTGGLFGGIAKAIRGDDQEYMAKKVSEGISQIKQNIPDLLVEKIEIPGAAIQQPDGAAVAALIPPAPLTPTIIAQPLPTPASTPGATNKIEARKNLHGMGFAYHSQEHFISSIKRKDDVAVQLFLDAGGIDLNTKDARGKTAFDIANEIGASDIAKMIADHVKDVAQQVSATSQGAPSVQQAAKAKQDPVLASAYDEIPSDPAARAQALAVAKALLPADILASVNENIDREDLPAAQKEELRAKAIINLSRMYTATRAVVDAQQRK